MKIQETLRKALVPVLVALLGTAAPGLPLHAQEPDPLQELGACLAVNPPSECRDIIPK